MFVANNYMNLAMEQAKKAALIGEIPVGAVIVKNKEVIALAHNLKETNNDSTAHAEIVAIREAGKKLKSWHLEECSIYVTLEPCHMCLAAIIEARISRVVYGAYDIKMGAHVSNRNRIQDSVSYNLDIVGGVMEKQSENILKEFFRTLRKDKHSV